jgi:ABC-type hemin transport system substrate-binding protein
MTHPFEDVRDALENAQRGCDAAQDGPILQQLTALGLVSPAPDVEIDTDTDTDTETDTDTKGETKAAAQPRAGTRQHVLTADGRDVLEALRSSQRWAQVQEAAARQCIAVSLDTLKAAVAAAISGGFNA